MKQPHWMGGEEEAIKTHVIMNLSGERIVKSCLAQLRYRCSTYEWADIFQNGPEKSWSINLREKQPQSELFSYQGSCHYAKQTA